MVAELHLAGIQRNKKNQLIKLFNFAAISSVFGNNSLYVSGSFVVRLLPDAYSKYFPRSKNTNKTLIIKTGSHFAAQTRFLMFRFSQREKNNLNSLIKTDSKLMSLYYPINSHYIENRLCRFGQNNLSSRDATVFYAVVPILLYRS